MKEQVEREKLREAYNVYLGKLSHLWNNLIKEYNFDKHTAMAIIANFWYEPDNAEEFDEEWMDGSDKIRDNIEKQFGVCIEHEDELITVKSKNFVYDGNLVIEEDK